MKRCPTCNRTFTDDTQKFCLDDGATLLEENAAPFDPQATLAMVGSQPTTPPSNPYGSGSGASGSGAGQGSYGSQGGQGSYGSGAGQQGSSWNPSPQGFTPSAPAAKRSVLPWVLGGAAVVVLGLIGIVVVIAIAFNNSTNTNSNNSNEVANSNNSNKSNSNKATRTTDIVIKSSNGKIQVSVPSTWKSTTELNDNAELQVSDSANQMYLIVLTDDKAKYASMDIDKHSGETLDTLTKSMTYANKVGPVRLTINGNPAVQYEVRGEIKNLNVIYIHTTIETPNNFQQIVAWTLQSEYPKRESTIKDIINSFKEN